MKFHLFTRRTHYWVSVVIALPVLLVLITGILLQLKKNFVWIQPTEQRGRGKEPTVLFTQVLAACQTVPEAEIHDWQDIARLDLRPNKGIIKITAQNNWEIQIDAQSGSVLQAAYRRSDLIESLHDGSWFSNEVKLGLFLPAGLLLLFLWFTGMYLFFFPIWVRYRRKRLAAKS